MNIFTIVLGIQFTCTTKTTDTSTINEIDEPANTEEETSAVTVTNQSVSSDDCDNPEIPDDVLTVLTENGHVLVTHDNFDESACLGFDINAALDGDIVRVTYTETGEPCDCISLYSLSYQIEGLPSGTYTLNASAGNSGVNVVGEAFTLE